MRPVKVGIIGAGNVIWAYFQVLDRLIPRGLARVGPVCARRRENWENLRKLRPEIELAADPVEVLHRTSMSRSLSLLRKAIPRWYGWHWSRASTSL